MKREVTHPQTLPDELIHEILLRFKSVHKSWLSLISEPGFAKSHFDLAAAPSHRLLLKCFNIDPEVDNSYVDMVSNIPLPLSAMGSMHGKYLYY